MIFNKNENGIKEVKRYLTFVYSGIEFRKLEYYIEFALRDVIPYISKEVYNLALNHYQSENYKEDSDATLDVLVRKIQASLAFFGYKRFVPSNDLTHSEKGRQIFVSDDEKPAFEWMIDSDNKNLLNISYESLESLMEFLEDNKDDDDIVDVWTSTEAYKATKELIVQDATTFNTVFPIDRSRRLYVTLVPFIREVQNDYIRPCFSKESWDILMEQFLDDDLSDVNKEVVRLARIPLVLYSISLSISRLNISLFPEGVFNNYVTGQINSKSTAYKTARIDLQKNLFQDANSKMKKLHEFLRKNRESEIFEENTVVPIADITKKYIRL